MYLKICDYDYIINKTYDYDYGYDYKFYFVIFKPRKLSYIYDAFKISITLITEFINFYIFKLIVPVTAAA